MEPVIEQLTQVDDIYNTIVLFDSDIVPAISERGLDLKEYARKLFEFGMVYTLEVDNRECGYVAFYANDTNHKTAYLAQIAVKSQFFNRGFGYTLLKKAMKTSKEMGMKKMKLEVYSLNHSAIAFYKRQGFKFYGEGSGEFCHMQKEL